MAGCHVHIFSGQVGGSTLAHHSARVLTWLWEFVGLSACFV